MIESGESLSYSEKHCSVLEKIASLHDIKQNEKYPLIVNLAKKCHRTRKSYISFMCDPYFAIQIDTSDLKSALKTFKISNPAGNPFTINFF